MADGRPIRADDAADVAATEALEFAHPAVRRWFAGALGAPTEAQVSGWPSIAAGRSTLLLAPTGSGKTLAAFLAAIDRLMFGEHDGAEPSRACRVLYVSPLKALGVDVERNLEAPIAGIRAAAEGAGEAFREPSVGVRTGDTPQSQRARMLRNPPEILITTPESLYLLLTSRGRETLERVETVIVDEIHSLVATKRGAHLFASLERLEGTRASEAPPLQRIGLSATQRPLEEVARLLGGGTFGPGETWVPRPVEIVDAGRRRAIDLRVEVPVEDMARLGDPGRDVPTGPSAPALGAAQGAAEGEGASEADGDAAPKPNSIWPAIHPRLVELIREHRSTMIFVNSRRLSERLAASLNEEAGEELALAHHGSLAKEKRARIEGLLKRGELPAIVATSSLELGIDMGAVDLVIQIEAPPSVASGIQRVGRAGHQVDAESRGVIFPKHRGDLLACAAATPDMLAGRVEATHYPRNPLDVLAQQIVAEVSIAEGCDADSVFALFRGAAPFAELPRSAFEGVLDMLSGRYPSDEFAELRPRLTWDRISGGLEPRHGARRIAVVNGGTIPDRGLYGVFLADGGEGGKSRRVGELDEEMVYESRPGEVFLLGASSWRIEDIGPDRVTVLPAPGEPGRMPFWRGDRPARAFEFGKAIGALSARLARMSVEEGAEFLGAQHGLDPDAARNLARYVSDQQEAAGAVPTDDTIVCERFVDEVGDWRVCVLSPFGARVHQPWATAVRARLVEREGIEVDVVVADDGIVFRLPESDSPPDPALFFPGPDEVEELVVRALSDTSLFAARFRENAARALLLPRRFPTKRVPLWAQRRKSSDLLKVAARFDQFPIILETYRECLRDVFDLPALRDLMRDIAHRKVRVAAIETRAASPFASSLLFTFVGNFLYDGDAPLAERRAQILSIDHAQLRELLGEAELRALLDAEAIDEVEASLQRRSEAMQLRYADALHDLLLALGPLSRNEIEERCEDAGELDSWLGALQQARRIVSLRIGTATRYGAAEDAGRFRDALGVELPDGLPEALLEAVADPLGDLVSRYARTHGPFRAEEAAARFGLGVAPVLQTLQRLAAADRLVEGEFLPSGHGREWCDGEVLRRIKQRSLAKLRKQVEPVEPAVLGRFLPDWHGLGRGQRGLDALVDAIEQLQGCPLPVSVLEAEILPARIEGYRPGMLDELCAAGEVVWRGVEPIGANDGRIALYLADHFDTLAPPAAPADGELAARIREFVSASGATFFSAIADGLGGFPGDLVAGLWQLVWAGELTNDTLAPLRSLVAGAGVSNASGAGPRRGRGRRGANRRPLRGRRLAPPTAEGRWSLLGDLAAGGDARPSETERRTAFVRQLLDRHGVLVREVVRSEGVEGGFSTLYPVLKAMEESGALRRGYFVAGLGATQFALPGADERLRAARSGAHGVEVSERPGDSSVRVLAATDPANPYGAALRWPETSSTGGARPGRSAGAQVVLHEGELIAWLGRGDRQLLTFLPKEEPERGEALRALAATLAERADELGPGGSLCLASIDGVDAPGSPLAQAFVEAGFEAAREGLRRRAPTPGSGALRRRDR